jgi:hypothetical protein
MIHEYVLVTEQLEVVWSLKEWWLLQEPSIDYEVARQERDGDKDDKRRPHDPHRQGLHSL